MVPQSPPQQQQQQHNEQQYTGPAAVVVTQPPTVVQHQAEGTRCDDCCVCLVPSPNASRAVITTRLASFFILVFHVFGLACFGFLFWAQRIASLCGIVMGSVVLIKNSKSAYIAATIVYLLGAVFDILSVVVWISIPDVMETEGDDDFDNRGHSITIIVICRLLAIPPAIGAVWNLVGSVAAFVAICEWADSGAPNETRSGGETNAYHPSVIIMATQIGATQASPLHHYPQQHVAKEGGPPAYSGTV